MRGVEEEGAEQGHTGAVVQHRQVGLGELESRRALLLQLPRGVQEQQEHGSLADTRWNGITQRCPSVSTSISKPLADMKEEINKKTARPQHLAPKLSEGYVSTLDGRV